MAGATRMTFRFRAIARSVADVIVNPATSVYLHRISPEVGKLASEEAKMQPRYLRRFSPSAVGRATRSSRTAALIRKLPDAHF